MMRWWWFGPSVDRAEIDRELAVMAAAGIGGVEVSYVYPLSPDSAGFVSPEFLADLRYAADAARALGLLRPDPGFRMVVRWAAAGR